MLAAEKENAAESLSQEVMARWPEIQECEIQYCANHDDGETRAVVMCRECNIALCSICDACLHLPQAKRSHHRPPVAVQERPQLIIANGTAKLKTSGLLALADSAKQKGVLELRRSAPTAGIRCRFCGGDAEGALSQVEAVCSDEECREKLANACRKVHPCGPRVEGC